MRSYQTLTVELKDGRLLKGTYPTLAALARQQKAYEFGAVRADLSSPTEKDLAGRQG